MKIIQYMLFFSLTTALVACKTEGVDKSKETIEKIEPRVDSLELNLPVHSHLTLDNGIEIVWLEKPADGEAIKAGDVVMIDYKVRLADSTIIDGNHLLNKPNLPFIVGYGLQPKGWDIAFKHLHVGDFARIKLPSEFARGKKGIENLVPQDADNYLTVRIISKREPSREIDGNKVWIFEENVRNKKKFNENNKIIFHTTISSESNPFYFNSYANQQPFELRLTDNGVVPGLKKALINAKKGDRMFITVPADQAYGSKGYLNIVKPNESLLYNVLVMDIVD